MAFPNLEGRPVKFTPEELENKIKEYFEYCDQNKKPYTIAGIAYFIGTDRQTIYNYEKSNDEQLFGIIKRARDKILSYLEERLYEEGKPGQIFIAKNYGYTDKQEIVSENHNVNENLDTLSKEERENRIKELYSKLTK